MRAGLIYVRFDMKHIPTTLSIIKSKLNKLMLPTGGDEPKKHEIILFGGDYSKPFSP